MMTKTPLRMAVVGCGYWGINHVRTIAEMINTELVAVCDRDSNRLREVERRYPKTDVFTDFELMLSAVGHEIDAVVIATNATQHHEIARELIRAGKHVLIEKPITTDTAQALELVREAEAANVRLMVGHIFLFNSAIELMKSYVTRGDLGEIHYLYAQRTNLGPVRHDVNALWDLATHDVSVFNYLLDAGPLWVSAVGSKVLHNNRHDVGFMVLGYPNGILGHIHVSWADPHKVREMVIVGSNERIAFNDLDPVEKVRVFEKGIGCVQHTPDDYAEYDVSIRDGDIISPHFKINEPLRNELNHFIDCVINDRHPLSDGLMGAQVVQVMRAVDESIEHNGTPVSIEPLPTELEALWTPALHSSI